MALDQYRELRDGDPRLATAARRILRGRDHQGRKRREAADQSRERDDLNRLWDN